MILNKYYKYTILSYEFFKEIEIRIILLLIIIFKYLNFIFNNIINDIKFFASPNGFMSKSFHAFGCLEAN